MEQEEKIETKEEKYKRILNLRDKLQDEDNELFEKMLKIEDVINTSCIYTKLSNSQLNLLDVQLQAMRTYHLTLRARINDYHRELYELEKGL